MGADPDIGKFLGQKERAVLFFQDQDSVVFRIIRQIHGSVPGDGVPAHDLIRRDLPFAYGARQAVAEDDLVMIGIHDEIIVPDPGDAGGDAERGMGIGGGLRQRAVFGHGFRDPYETCFFRKDPSEDDSGRRQQETDEGKEEKELFLHQQETAFLRTPLLPIPRPYPEYTTEKTSLTGNFTLGEDADSW